MIVDYEQLTKKLKEAGYATVVENLSLGLYRKEKIKAIEYWLSNHELEAPCAEEESEVQKSNTAQASCQGSNGAEDCGKKDCGQTACETEEEIDEN